MNLTYLAPGEYTRGLSRKGPPMANTLAILLTATTYGTWLRGDARGWVDDGMVFPPDPVLEAADRLRMKYPVYLLPAGAWRQVGDWIGAALRQRSQVSIHALFVGTWHAHVVVGANRFSPSALVKCMKDAVRWGLRPGRPIWADGYDKRYCYEEKSVRARIEYVERHNLAVGRPAKPWPFIEPPRFI